MTQHVKHFIKTYEVCQKNKVDNLMPHGLLQPLGIPDLVWSEISMDFIKGLPRSNGKTVVFVVVDKLSKYAHFMALQQPFTAIQVAKVFFDNVFKHHGLSKMIVSDRDPLFLGNFW